MALVVHEHGQTEANRIFAKMDQEHIFSTSPVTASQQAQFKMQNACPGDPSRFASGGNFNYHSP